MASRVRAGLLFFSALEYRDPHLDKHTSHWGLLKEDQWVTSTEVSSPEFPSSCQHVSHAGASWGLYGAESRPDLQSVLCFTSALVSYRRKGMFCQPCPHQQGGPGATAGSRSGCLQIWDGRTIFKSWKSCPFQSGLSSVCPGPGLALRVEEQPPGNVEKVTSLCEAIRPSWCRSGCHEL